MTIIKCKNCENTKNYTGTTMSNLQFLDANERDDKNWCCGDCENKYINHINQIKRQLKELKTEVLNYKKSELIQLVNEIKSKLKKPRTIQMYFERNNNKVIGYDPDWEAHRQLDILLESQRKCLQEPNASSREQLGKSKEFLEKKLTSEEIQILLGKRIEINELEKQLESLQIQESKTEIFPK